MNNIVSLRTLTMVIFCMICLLGRESLAGSDPMIKEAQKRLQALGYVPGPVDGVMGSKTKSSIELFQKDSMIPVTKILDEATNSKLLAVSIKVVSVDTLSAIEDTSVEYLRGELNSAIGNDIIRPKDGMNYAVAIVLLKNGLLRNISIDLGRIWAVDENQKKHKSKAYTVFKNSYFPYAYYTSFNGALTMPSEESTIRQLVFEDNGQKLKLLGIRENSDITFKVVFELPEETLISAVEWYGDEVAATVALPVNGKIEMYEDRLGIAPLNIVTKGEDVNYFVKLVNMDTNKPVQTIFVRAGHSVNTKVPLGSYHLKYAAGNIWLGNKQLFGVDTIYKKAKKRFDFKREDGEISGYTVELILQSGGNLPTSKIPKSEW